MVMENGALEVRNLTKRFNGSSVLQGVSLSVTKGSITSLIGPNGAGKSTLFNIIGGVHRPDSGQIYLGSEPIAGLSSRQVALRGVSYFIQDFPVFPGMTALENVIIGMGEQPGESFFRLFFNRRSSNETEILLSRSAKNLLRSYGLSGREGQAAGKLSYGEQKRVALARLHSTPASLLLLDEPAAGINHSFLDELSTILLGMKVLGKTLFLIEHNMDLVMRVSDYIYVMDHGSVVARGTPSEVWGDEQIMNSYLGGGAIGVYNRSIF
jgi:branched-chain amino acid transport system ATP-binding protein